MLRSMMSPILGVVSDLDGSLASLACQKNKGNLSLYFFSDRNKITKGNRLKFATLETDKETGPRSLLQRLLEMLLDKEIKIGQ